MTITLTDDELEMLLTGLEELQKQSVRDDNIVREAVRLTETGVTTKHGEFFINNMKKRRNIQHLANKLRAGEA